ncbi:restriction endonuclease [Methylocella silvestris]|uniref:Restriction endonuclease n=1 Tax=Methylocella silvestris TaxID=199596 RepID=A0A2J7TF52_METSI|nr:restriction endonuclease [Methylocella silvestris]PNG25405.1 restriction endonuclease [Methylocella silvestris]
MPSSWMIRAGRQSLYFEIFRTEKFVSVGWAEAGNLSGFHNRKALAAHLRLVFSDYTEQMAIVAAGQLFRFVKEIKIGDQVVTYDGGARTYLCGRITGDYVFDPKQEIDGLSNRRTVDWEKERSRDDLSQTARNTLGSTLTLFQIPESVSGELWADGSLNEAARFETDLPGTPTDSTASETLASLATATSQEIEDQASERIKDRVAKLNWEQMQELVAALLRAMGYVTRVSKRGADRGKDIEASLDGFGFVEPRVIVEVKHRSGRMGAPEIRSFLGGRKPHEKSLYVSTGGFTQEAYYEAERASIPIKLLDNDGLITALLGSYSKLDETTRRLLPLKQIYWPST